MLCVLATLDDCRIEAKSVEMCTRVTGKIYSDGENVTCDLLADNCVRVYWCGVCLPLNWFNFFSMTDTHIDISAHALYICCSF